MAIKFLKVYVAQDLAEQRHVFDGERSNNAMHEAIGSINDYMKRHSRVKALRFRYAHMTFFVKSLYFVIYIIVMIYGSFSLLNLARNNDNMPRSILQSFAKVDPIDSLDSGAGIWLWVKNDFLKGLPIFYKSFRRIGVIRITQIRYTKNAICTMAQVLQD